MTTRRLAAILAADLVGFSSMIPIRSHHRLLLEGIGASPDAKTVGLGTERESTPCTVAAPELQTAEEGALSLRSGSPRSRLSSPSHAALTAPPFAAMTTTRTRVRPSESTLLVAGGICIPLMSQSLSLARSSRHQDHASLCLSAEGPPDLCDRPCVARGRRRRAEIRQEFGSLVALGRAGVHHWRFSRHW